MPPRDSLRTFLTAARNALTAPQRQKPLTLVVGNESADLDSLCSALVLAYIRTQAPPHKLHVPVANIPRLDLALRPEFTAVLKQAELEPGDVPTLSDVNHTVDTQDTTVLLVDHNAITGQLSERFAERVVGCVDHHVDEKKIPEDTGEEPRVIEQCGSCASLVVEYCKSAWSELGFDKEEDASLAKLALAPILIDTVNLTNESKITPKDTSATSFLESRLPKTFDRAAYYEELSEKKQDISSFTFHDILRKDYKEWREGDSQLGMSTVVQNLEYLVKKAGNEQVLLHEMFMWADERKLDIFAMMTTSAPNGQFQRQLFVLGLNEQGVRAAKKFVENSEKDLKLEQWNGGRLDVQKPSEGEVAMERGAPRQEWFRAWRQLDLSSSRKQVGPLIREAMRNTARL